VIINSLESTPRNLRLLWGEVVFVVEASRGCAVEAVLSPREVMTGCVWYHFEICCGFRCIWYSFVAQIQDADNEERQSDVEDKVEVLKRQGRRRTACGRIRCRWC
jgi:hypothetical protein